MVSFVRLAIQVILGYHQLNEELVKAVPTWQQKNLDFWRRMKQMSVFLLESLALTQNVIKIYSPVCLVTRFGQAILVCSCNVSFHHWSCEEAAVSLSMGGNLILGSSGNVTEKLGCLNVCAHEKGGNTRSPAFAVARLSWFRFLWCMGLLL